MLSGIIDYTILFILLSIGGGIIASLLAIDSPAFSLVVMELIVFPIKLFIYTIRYPDFYGNETVLLLGVVAIFFCLEVLYFTLLETCFHGRSIGLGIVKTKIVYESGEKPRFLIILFRNCLKTVSRYLFCVPFLTIFLTKRKQALYDLMTKIVVVQK